jgi:thioredoxin-related protein
MILDQLVRILRSREGLPALLLLVLICWQPPGFANEPPMGKFYGARTAEKPDWFKDSFLEFEEDVSEAAESGRRVMLYFHQDGCPYCARLIEENFADPQLKSYIVENFDGISLNMWGDREVISVGGRQFTEKTFAAALKVQYTPTLLFLDESGKTVLRLNGYYPPNDFRAALQYVAQKREADMSFAQFRLDSLGDDAGILLDEDFFVATTDLGGLLQESARPLVVYFETTDCRECETMHKRILADAPTRELVQQASNVQFNVASQQIITTPDGRRLSVNQWARDLGIAYTPSLVFFDAGGKEVMRIDAFLKTFHFQSVYAYVLDKAYLEVPEFQRYISARADHIRESGFDTDIWGYDSFHD